MKLDSTDEKIMECLLEDGRMSYREIAERTGVTPPTIKSRIDNLTEEGVIKGFTVTINEEKLVGEGQLVNAIVVVKTGSSDVDRVYDELTASDDAKSVIKTADSKVLVKFAGNHASLRNLLANLPDGIRGYRTIIVTDESKEKPRITPD